MKKILSIILIAVLTFSFSACGSGNEKQTNEDQSSIKSALELLNTVWESYGEDEKFSVAGGDTSEENLTMEAPGKYSIDDPSVVDTILAFPASSVEKIDDAASLIHMLNANTFTCGAYHVKDKNDIREIVSAIKDTITQRHWMCGAPEKFVVITVDDYIVSCFGHEEFVDTFKKKLCATYVSTEVLCEEPLM